jgi:hypothetical protein
MSTETFTAYDIECLMHVYNKFGRRIINATQLLKNTNIRINADYNSYKFSQPCTISAKLATFLGQPADSILPLSEIYRLFKVYRYENNLIINSYCIQDCMECTPELRNLLNLGTPNMTSIPDILDTLIDHEDIQIVMPDDSYVLK